MFDKHGMVAKTYITRTIVSSGRNVLTVEYADQPELFYVVQSGRSVSGAFNIHDARFKIAQ